MREIKFRAWNRYARKMADVKVMLLATQPNITVQLVGENPLQYLAVNENVDLMQYTGLKDKNGREIYEGDIVTHAAIQRTGPVVYREDTACFAMEFEGGTTALSYALLSEKPWEVIGNIYENPELLKKDNES